MTRIAPDGAAAVEIMWSTRKPWGERWPVVVLNHLAKSLNDELRLHGNIVNVTGATLPSQAWSKVKRACLWRIFTLAQKRNEFSIKPTSSTFKWATDWPTFFGDPRFWKWAGLMSTPLTASATRRQRSFLPRRSRRGRFHPQAPAYLVPTTHVHSFYDAHRLSCPYGSAAFSVPLRSRWKKGDDLGRCRFHLDL